MKSHFLRIGTQLNIGFAIIMTLLVLMATISYVQTNQLFTQADTLYRHPLNVLTTVGNMREDIYKSQISIRDQLIAHDESDRQMAIEQRSAADAEALLKFEMLYDRYLGPRENIDDAYIAFTTWKNEIDKSIGQIETGSTGVFEESLSNDGTIGILRQDLLNKIAVISDFASAKAAELYTNYVELDNTLTLQLILLVVATLLLTLLISVILTRKIRTPLKALSAATEHFHQGDLDARCQYAGMNEFGELSSSFNIMVETIQTNLELNNKAAQLVGVMLSQEDARAFFRATLRSLADHTGAQMCAVYLLSESEKSFELFESIGLNNKAKTTFDADNFEGEPGLSLGTNHKRHLIRVAEDSQMVFSAISGDINAHEIMTIPIKSQEKTIAIISLASTTKFMDHAAGLIDSVLVTLSARVEGVLAYRTIENFRNALAVQNQELELQKNELTQQNNELEIQKRQLDEGSKLKTNFLSNMSHELRTPLNSVIALSGILNRRLAQKIPEEEYSYLEIIERNGKNLLAMINDILDISRIEAGREEIEITSFNPNHVVADVVALLQIQAQQKNIKLINEVNEPDIMITSDATKVNHILLNIIGNAIKFTEKGTVKVSLTAKDSNLEIVISDTGIGMNEDYLPHIFDEFRQADASTSRKYGGTGLGMAIAQKYAHLLGGAITVQSKLGKGSTFTISLPLGSIHETVAKSFDRLDGQANGHRSHRKPDAITNDKIILLVEDSEAAIIQIKDVVEELGYRLLIAQDAAEAFRIMDQITPNAIMLDLMMPVIDGFEVLKTIRNAERTAHVPVLVLTAKQITKDELKFLKHNSVHQLIQKGDVNRLELQNAIDSMLFPPQSATTRRAKPLILIVEDNPDNMITAKAILADHYDVIGAINGQEGIEMAIASVPDLILMDIELPLIDGIKAFAEIRNMPQLQHIPIIALTASAMIHDRETILAHGFDAFITKPIIEKQFFKVINEVLYGQ